MGWYGAWVMPLMDLGVPVGEVEAARIIMVVGGEIDNRPLFKRSEVEERCKKAIINAVVPLVEHHECVYRGQMDHFRNLPNDFESRTPLSKADANRSGCGIVVAHPIVHRHRAYT